jgi:hypothetical protein
VTFTGADRADVPFGKGTTTQDRDGAPHFSFRSAA